LARCLRPRAAWVGGLRQVRLEPGRLDLLDHITPPGAALHRHRHRAALCPAGQVAAQPPPEPLPIGLPHPAPPLHTRVDLERIEGDLPPMQIQPTSIAIRDLLDRPRTLGKPPGCPHTRRGGPHTLNVQGSAGHAGLKSCPWLSYQAPLSAAAEVELELAPDGVADPTLEGAQRLLVRLPLGVLALVVGPARRVVADLGDLDSGGPG
jgi:hypothetical protein